MALSHKNVYFPSKFKIFEKKTEKELFFKKMQCFGVKSIFFYKTLLLSNRHL